MGQDDQQIPTDGGKHHTWKTAPEKKYKGTHRKSDRTAKDEEEKK